MREGREDVLGLSALSRRSNSLCPHPPVLAPTVTLERATSLRQSQADPIDPHFCPTPDPGSGSAISSPPLSSDGLDLEEIGCATLGLTNTTNRRASIISFKSSGASPLVIMCVIDAVHAAGATTPMTATRSVMRAPLGIMPACLARSRDLASRSFKRDAMVLTVSSPCRLALFDHFAAVVNSNRAKYCAEGG